MERIRIWLSRAADVVLGARRERRLRDEIEHHLDLLTEELKRAGMADADARLAARRQFGGIDQLRITHREVRGLPVIESIVQDLRFAVRVLLRDRGFALTAMLVLGVGLGVNNLFFTLFYAHKLRGLPIPNAERVLSISSFDDRANDRLSLPEYDELTSAQSSFSTIGAYVAGPVTVRDEDRAPERFDGAYVTASAFDVLGIAPLLGRLPEARSDRPGSSPVVLLGADAWRSRYANDPDLVGRTILVNGSPATVVGIIPERSGFPSTANVWLPLGQLAEWRPDRSVRSLRVIGRLREEASETAARREIETIFSRLETAYPETNRNVRARVVPLNDRVLGSLEGWMQFLYAGIIVILVACANVANLMIARALQRAPEIAIRTSLGASRGRVVAQLLTEAALIAAGGVVIGLLISGAGVRMVQAGIPAGILPYWLDYTMDRTVFVTLLGVALASVVIFGVLPALHASRTDVNRTLKDGGRSATASPAMRVWTDAFLAMQLALAVILLAQVALVSYLADRSIPTDENIHTTEVITAAVTLPSGTYADARSRMAFFSRLEERLRGRPEVHVQSRTTMLPGEIGGAPRRLHLRGEQRGDGAQPATVLAIEVTPEYFSTLGLGVLRGRDFTPGDGTDGAAAAIVNERFAEVFLAGSDPLAVSIALSATTSPVAAVTQWMPVVGLAPVIRQQGTGGLAEQPPVVYLPIETSQPATSTLMVRHGVDSGTAAEILRAEALAVDPNVPLFRVRTLEQAVRDAQWNRHTSVVLADTVTSMSVLLAIVGLYAVTAQRVMLRTREIGLRIALGARAVQIVLTTMSGLRIALTAGILLGVTGAMAWEGTFATGLQGAYVAAPPTLLKVASLMTAFVAVSCVIPIWRATRMNPVTALRHE